MRHHLQTIFVLGLFAVFSPAAGQQWQWSFNSGGTSNASGTLYGNTLDQDGSGNLYQTGVTFGTTNAFGLNGVTLNGEGTYVAQFDASGNCNWARHIADKALQDDMETEHGGPVFSVDANGNYVVAVLLKDSATFGGSTLLHARTGRDIVVAKFNSAGTMQWIEQIGNNGNLKPTDIAMDASGNVYLSGRFQQDTLTFGSNTIINSSMWNPTAFISKIDANGNREWAYSTGYQTYHERANKVIVHPNGEIWWGGYFADSLGPAQFTHAAWLVRTSATGSILGSEEMSSVGRMKVFDMYVDGSQNLYICGEHFDQIDFGNGVILNTLFNTNGHSFVAKFNSGLSAQWADGHGNKNLQTENATAVTADGNGNVYVASRSYGDMYLSNGDSIMGGSYWNLAVIKYDANGNITWTAMPQTVPGTVYDYSEYASDLEQINNEIFMDFSSQSELLMGSDTTQPGMVLTKLGSGTAGMAESMLKNNLTVYPNPVKDELMLDVQDGLQVKTAVIYSLEGREVYRTAQAGLMDISNLSAGIYVLKIETEAGSAAFKIVKQ